jgi:hypothetical protein
MAIILEEQYKGIAANYWRINEFKFNDLTGEAMVKMGLYVNAAAADGQLSANLLSHKTLILQNVGEIVIDQDVTGITARNVIKGMLYSKIMEPEMEEYVSTPAEIDDDGIIITEPIMEERNINPWSGGVFA